MTRNFLEYHYPIRNPIEVNELTPENRTDPWASKNDVLKWKVRNKAKGTHGFQEIPKEPPGNLSEPQGIKITY